ncbi:MAG TPA: hypothetical protein VGJ13_06395 [Pseudonocardiaceae bacterium]
MPERTRIEPLPLPGYTDMRVVGSWRRRLAVTLESRATAPHRARTVLNEACVAWAIPASTAEMARLVLSELVEASVEHASEMCHVVVEFDRTRTRLSVAGPCEGVPRVRPRDLWIGWRGRGLQGAADQWGVEYLDQIELIWAVITPAA